MNDRFEPRTPLARLLWEGKQWDGRPPPVNGIDVPEWQCHQLLEREGATLGCATLGRATATYGTEAMLFDEPASALNRELMGDVLGVMRQLAEEGMTMIVVTHEMGFAREVADRVCFLHSGTLVEEGASSEVLAAPVQPHTQEFLRRVLHAPTGGAA